jgi:hypothetical protein
MSDKQQETEYTAKLRAMIEPMMRQAKNDLAKTGRVAPLLTFGFRKVQAVIPMPDHIAELLESGGGKDILFGRLRAMVHAIGCDSFAILTDAWFSKATPAGGLLDPGRFTDLYSKLGSEEMEKRGYITREEVIMATAQTPERMMVVAQPYVRGEGRSITFGEAHETEMPMDMFEGRQKMFGDTSEENLHLHRNSGLGKKQAAAEKEKRAKK